MRLMCIRPALCNPNGIELIMGEIYHSEGNYECPKCRQAFYILEEDPEPKFGLYRHTCGYIMSMRGERGDYHANRFIEIDEYAELIEEVKELQEK